MSQLYLFFLFLGLNTLMVLIFLVFIVDDPHFYRMFKIVIIFTECLKWYLSLPNV